MILLKRISFTAVLLAGLLAAALLPAGSALAQRQGIALIRDAEIEHIIRTWTAPLLEAAGLDPASVRIHLVNDRSLNAFVAGGQRIFIHTGLLMRSENPGQVIGVVAHEAGHISGGHLARVEDALRGAYVQTLLSMVLGAAAIVSGAGDAGAAIMAGGQQIAERTLLQYTRTQESAADQAALTFLDRTAQSGRGLVEFLEILGDQEALLAERQDPYARTHPIGRERLSALRSRVEQSKYYGRELPPEFVEMHKLMKAKLVGFLEPLGTTLRKYPLQDESLPARYARTIAWYRVPDLNKALPEIDRLLAERPGDPYFLELKGQMLFENGRVAESIPVLETAVRAMPQEPLLRYALGQAQVASEDAALIKPAIANLEEAVRRAPDHPGAWYQLSVAYGRDGQLGLAHLAAAERYMLNNRFLDAKQQSERARGKLPAGSPAALRAEDLAALADKRLQEERDRQR